MDKKLLINLVPGDTFLHKLNGQSKVQLFLLSIVFYIACWDMRYLLPATIVALLAFLTTKPRWKTIEFLVWFMLISNLLNFFLLWLVEPNYGIHFADTTTKLLVFNARYFISRETLWYFAVRLLKFIGTFLVSLTFVMTITPSQFAAGLNAIGVPYKVCTIISLALRYIPEIQRDFMAIRVSMQCRGMELDPKKEKFFKRVKENAMILLPLIVTSFERVTNIANAMDLRGYGKKKKRTYYAEPFATKWDRLSNVVSLCMLAFLVWYIAEYKFINPPRFSIWNPWTM